MGQLIALGSGAFLVAGLLLIIAGLRRSPRSQPVPSAWQRHIGLAWHRQSPLKRGAMIAVMAAEVLIGVATGWLAAIVLVPTVVLGIPYLLSTPPNHEVDTLAALDRWVRFLGPSIATGKSIRDAIIATRTQVPPLLAEPMARLVARMDLGWSTHDALLTMADELESTDADGVLAALAIAASRGGVGARTMLAALAENIQQRLRALREIAAERAKPRAVVRQVVIITVAILGVVWVLSPGYFAPYYSPVGQVLALLLASAYVGALVMLRRRTRPRPSVRFLKAQ